MKNLVVGSALLLLAPLAPAQTWTQFFPATSPFSVFAHDMVHDSARGRTVLYGGFGYFTSSPDMYEFDGSTWTLLLRNPNPGARDSHVMTYDPMRQVTILWGGRTGDLLGQRTWLDDTWEYDGVRWTRNNTHNRPPQWVSGRLVFDVGRQRAVWFGGYERGTAQVHNETWEYDGNDWIRVITPTTPPARAQQAMAYDAVRGVVVMFGGWVQPSEPPLSDTWEYDGTDWTRVTTATSPSPRHGFRASFDPARAVTVLHGGSGEVGLLRDTWEYDGSDWYQTAAAGPIRSYHTQVYDTSLGKTLIWGGFDGTSNQTNTTWTYEGPPVASWVPFGAGCVGSVGTPTLAPAGTSRPALGTTFTLELGSLPSAGGLGFMITGFDNTTWNGLPLPLELSQFGLAGCHLHVAPFTGLGHQLVHSGGTATWSLALPSDPTFAGLSFYNQGVSFDAGAANGFAAFSNAGTGTVR